MVPKSLSIFWICILLFLSRGLLFGEDAVDTSPTFSISPQQEENFNTFMNWLNKAESFKNQDNLKNTYRNVFSAMQENNYPDYLNFKQRLNTLFSRLTPSRKTAIFNFMRTLPMEKISEQPTIPPGSCRVECQFGSCEVNCPDGTKPKCFCNNNGFPDCGCEPYGDQEN